MGGISVQVGGVFVRGGLCPGESLSRSVSGGRGVSVGETMQCILFSIFLFRSTWAKNIHFLKQFIVVLFLATFDKCVSRTQVGKVILTNYTMEYDRESFLWQFTPLTKRLPFHLICKHLKFTKVEHLVGLFQDGRMRSV